MRKSLVIWLLTISIVLLGSATGAVESYTEGELVVGLTVGSTIDNVVAQFEVTAVQTLTEINVYLLNGIGSSDLLTLAAEIEELPEVEFCHPNYLIDPLQPVQTSLPVSDFNGGLRYHDQEMTSSMNLDDAHDVAQGSNVKVGIIDGGINFSHPALQDAVFSGYDYVDDDNVAFDEPGGMNSGHGTFVAGVIHLVAPDAAIYGYRVTDPSGASNGYLVAEAIMQSVSDGCQIVNLSMVTIEDHLAMQEAIAYARDAGVLIVAAAGNGHTADAHYPASDLNVLAVAAIDTMNLLADFSSFGPHIDVCAPGTQILAPHLESGYVWWGGTSFASPIVAAQAALLLSYDPTISGDYVRNLIVSTATNLDDMNPDYVGQLGAGMVNPVASLTALRGSTEVLRVPSEFATIQSAIDAALHGDRVLVGPGHYVENINFNGKAVQLISEEGPWTTWLSPAVSGSPIVIVGQTFPGSPTVSGFGFSGASESSALQVYANWPTYITNNIFFDNQCDTIDGDVVSIDGTTAEVTRNIFYNNSGRSSLFLRPFGSGVNVLAANNTFDNNQNGIYVRGSSVYGNDLDCIIVNNIISRSGQNALYTDDTPVYMGVVTSCDYNMFWDNGVDIDPNAVPAVTYNLFDDPEFIAPDYGEFHVMSTSPVIDAGHPDPEFFDTDGTIGDIGVYPAFVVFYPFLAGFEIDGAPPGVKYASLVPVFSWSMADETEATQTRYQIQLSSDGNWSAPDIWDLGSIASADTSVVYSGVPLTKFESYFVRVRVGNALAWTDWRSFQFGATAHVVYVPDDYSTISEAIEWAAWHDTIVVRAGIYDERVDIRGGGIVLISEEGPRRTVIKQTESEFATIRVYEANSVEINGFTIIGEISRGIHVQACSQLKIINNRITNCLAEGISVRYSPDPLISGNYFEANRGVSISAYSNDRVIIDSNQIIGNRTTGLSASNCDFVKIENNIVAFNRGFYGAIISYNDSISIVNNTFYKNEGRGLHISSPLGELLNCNFVGNGEEGLWLKKTSDYRFEDRWHVNYINSYANGLQDSIAYPEFLDVIMSEAPLYIDTTDGSCQLLAASPLIDAGDPRPELNDPDGSRSEIGAPSVTIGVLPSAVSLALTQLDGRGLVLNTTPTLHWEYLDDSPSAQQQVHIQVGTDSDWLTVEMWDTGPLTQSAQTIAYAGSVLTDGDTYYLRVSVSNGTKWGDWRERHFTIHTNQVVHVPGDFTTIQEAVDYCIDGDTILVSPGTYQEIINISDKELALISTNGSEVTSIVAPSGIGNTLLYIHSDYFLLEGFTFKNAAINVDVNGSAGIIRGNQFIGSAVYGLHVEWSHIEGVLIENNYFQSNRIALFMGQSDWGSRITGNMFFGNRNEDIPNESDEYEERGGALYIEWSQIMMIDHNVFQNNEAYYGAGITARQCRSITIQNNTFYNNRSLDSNGATIYFYWGTYDSDIRNNIFALSYGGDVIHTDYPNDQTNPIVYNDFFGNTGPLTYQAIMGAGNIFADPLITGANLHLPEGSPCINAGDPAYEYVDDDGTRSDMGAFPIDGGPCCEGPRGNVNGDEVNGNLADITMLIGSVYRGDSSPSCYQEANVNGDAEGKINLADITRLIDYVYISKLDPPSCDEFMMSPVAKNVVNNDVSLTAYYDDSKTTIVVESSTDLRGVHLQLVSKERAKPVKVIKEGLEMMYSYHDDTLLTLGLFDADGPGLIKKGRQSLVTINGKYTIADAEAVSLDHTTLYPNLGIEDGRAGLPQSFALGQNYPNPFNPTTSIRLSLPEATNVQLEIFNVLGQSVKLLVDEELPAGNHELIWNGTNSHDKPVASGIYLYRVRAGQYLDTKKMVLLK